MHPYAKPELPLLRNSLVLFPKPLLHLHSAPHRIDHTREFGKHAVASCVGYPTPVLSDEPVHDLTMSREGSHCARLVLTHEA